MIAYLWDCKSNTTVETLIKLGIEFSNGFWSVLKEVNLMTLVSSDYWFKMWQKRTYLYNFSFTVFYVLHWMK